MDNEADEDIDSKRDSSRWKKLTLMEKILFSVAVCVFISCVMLLIILGVIVGYRIQCNNSASEQLRKRESLINNATDDNSVESFSRLEDDDKKCHKICSSTLCQSEASFFLKNINKNVDPCDNFYEFACGKFVEDAVIPDDENKIDMLTLTQKKVIAQLKDKIQEDIEPDEISAFKKLKVFYKNCMNKTYIENNGVAELMETLDNLGGWPLLNDEFNVHFNASAYSWIETVYKIQDYGYPLIFPTTIHISIDPTNTKRNVINILNAHTRISQVYFLDEPNQQILQAYYSYMVDTAVMLGADREIATQEMKACLDFEVNLANIEATVDELSNITATHNPISVKLLSLAHPSIPWLELLNKVFNPNGVTVDETETVVLNDPNFIGELENLIGKTPKRVVANYLMWQVVYDSIEYLPSKFLDRKLLFQRVVHGVKERKTPSDECVRDVMDSFSIALSALYVRKYFNFEIKTNVLQLVRNVKDQFRSILQEVDWMDERTKKAALEKIEKMDVLVGYTDELFNDDVISEYYKELEISPGSYLKSSFNVSRFLKKEHYGPLRKPVNKKDWTYIKNAAVINAYYYLHRNAFEIPAGLLQGFFFNFQRPNYLNYGALGSVIGHEITHGFDNEGRKNDKNGEQTDWWQNSTKEKYLKKAACIVNQYNNFTIKAINYKLNGKRTQSENIADNGGYKIAYRAYNEWIKNTTDDDQEYCLTGLDYSPRQMFWISAASIWCRKQKLEYLRNAYVQDTHSPAEARVMIAFSNLPEFSQDFACSAESNMNPVHKCAVW